MFDRKIPEEVGVSSRDVLNYVNSIEENRLSTHDIIIAKGNDIIYEKYWAPFTADMTHRLYSSSKSIVALAIGFAIQDGLLTINDKIGRFFGYDEKTNYIAAQTIRDLLVMSNASSSDTGFLSVRKTE